MTSSRAGPVKPAELMCTGYPGPEEFDSGTHITSATPSPCGQAAVATAWAPATGHLDSKKLAGRAKEAAITATVRAITDVERRRLMTRAASGRARPCPNAASRRRGPETAPASASQ